MKRRVPVQPALSTLRPRGAETGAHLPLRRGAGRAAAATEMPKETTFRCRTQWSDLTQQAGAMKPFFRQIEARARQDGILPGVMRDLFARHVLDEIAAAANR